jgi:hypothetical protein
MLKTLTTVLLLISTPAFALDQEYLGKWIAAGSAPLREVCIPAAGFRITPQGMTADKTQCKIINETRDGTGWKVRLSYVIEGGKSTMNLRWQMMPNGHLQETQDGVTSNYERCPTK